jgi:hypothetical protein
VGFSQLPNGIGFGGQVRLAGKAAMNAVDFGLWGCLPFAGKLEGFDDKG